MRSPGFDAVVSFFLVVPAVFRPPPPVSSLGALRSDLSHETTAKLARLIALLDEWSSGRYRLDDPREAIGILDDMESAVARHARVAAGWFGTQYSFLLVLSSMRAARRLLVPATRGMTLSPGSIRTLQREVGRLKERCADLVERLSSKYGLRVGTLVERATAEVRRESGGGLLPNSVPIVLTGMPVSDSTWVPLSDAPAWEDLFRNVTRNAVEATRERASASDRVVEPSSVRVVLRSAERGDGTLVAIHDAGVGMQPAALERIWRTGVSSHGDGRGHGLSEAKLAFARERGDVEVRSETDAGTTFRITVDGAAVPIHPVPLWRLRTFTLPAALLVVSAGLFMGLQPRSELAHIEVVDTQTVRGVDRRDGTMWTARLEEEEILQNRPSPRSLSGAVGAWSQAAVHIRDRRGRLRGAVISAISAAGPGSLHFVDSLGTVRRFHRLRRSPPAARHLEYLRSHWQVLVPWGGPESQALLYSVRDGTHSAESVQLLGLSGDSIAAYYHPGHLHFRAALDLDGDQKTEILLHGINNFARSDSTIFSSDPGCYVDCLVLLRESEVTGQAYPYRAWEGMPPAREPGYLIIPPLCKGVRPEIRAISVRPMSGEQPGAIEFTTGDGRIYLTDAELRPVRCTRGNWTLADSLGLEYPMGPLAYFRQGQRSDIELPIR